MQADEHGRIEPRLQPAHRLQQQIAAVTDMQADIVALGVDAATGKATRVKTLPARFDASNLVTEQFEATSKDGTKVPYFIVHRRDLRLDGSTLDCRQVDAVIRRGARVVVTEAGMARARAFRRLPEQVRRTIPPGPPRRLLAHHAPPQAR